jgi:hypothetical protein
MARCEPLARFWLERSEKSLVAGIENEGKEKLFAEFRELSCALAKLALR